MLGEQIKFCPFQSSTEPSFWMKLGSVKLNDLRLSETPISVCGSYGITPFVTQNRAAPVQSERDGEPSGAPMPSETNLGILPGRMRFDQDSIPPIHALHSELDVSSQIFTAANEKVYSRGKVLVLNTLDSFKTIDKNEILNHHCLPMLLEACGVGDGRNQHFTTDNLTTFFCLCYLDLKCHKVVYWFAFPVIVPAPGKSLSYAPQTNPKPLKSHWDHEKIASLHHAFHTLRMHENNIISSNTCLPFFIVVPDDNGYLSCLPLHESTYQNLTSSQVYFGFIDPTDHVAINDSDPENSTTNAMGWPLRNLAAYLTLKLNLGGTCVQVISFRPGILRRIAHDKQIQLGMEPFRLDAHKDASIIMTILLCHSEDYLWPSDSHESQPGNFRCSGWELNNRSKPGPRSIDLSHLLSPERLTQQAIDLNLKLMKWRMIPSLDLETLSSIKVLLLGSGTLGCSVARTLLGWGVRNLVFVDNGKVSYSNPVRQSLFELKDCEYGGVDKAIAASEAVKRIAGSSIVSEGVVLSIPMPGHPFGDEEDKTVAADLDKLESLVNHSDVVFLLTDTRESRWLPTVLARAANKMLINAALGLDSWLVMRHGGNSANRLGCYFCNDVVAPENSTENRTLDQQCTVTRPGLAPLASSLAVELMVGLLHHKEKHNAPAPQSTRSASGNTVDELSLSPLGILPHQIRGSISSYTIMTPTVPCFEFCTGCSSVVVQQFKDHKFSFVKKVCCAANGTYLEELSGLTQFRDESNAKVFDCLESSWDDDDDVC